MSDIQETSFLGVEAATQAAYEQLAEIQRVHEMVTSSSGIQATVTALASVQRDFAMWPSASFCYTPISDLVGTYRPRLGLFQGDDGADDERVALRAQVEDLVKTNARLVLEKRRWRSANRRACAKKRELGAELVRQTSKAASLSSWVSGELPAQNPALFWPCD